MKIYKISEQYEKYKKKQLLIVLSLGLRQLLKRIYNNHGDMIARNFYDLHKNSTNTISYIDRSKEINKISYTVSDKVSNIIEERGYELTSSDIYKVKQGWLDNRTNTLIGRLLNKVLDMSEYDPKDIEIFVNRFKSESKKDTSGLNWERVYGRNLNKWYLQDNYLKGGGTLNKSCLRKSNRNGFVNFLSGNPKSCRLLILKNDHNQLVGRALMWKLSNINRVFMDRIYTRFDEDINLFIESAKKMGCIYKSKQTFGGEIELIDGKTGEVYWEKLEITDVNKNNFNGYPYMDTFQYYDESKKILTNDVSIFTPNSDVKKLNKVNGSYSVYGDDELGDALD